MSWMPERFVAPNILISTETSNTVSKRRQRRLRRAFAKVGLRKDRVERFNIDPPSIVVPAPLPKEVEEILVPKAYGFSGLQTYSQRQRARKGRNRVAQELYSPTRATFATRLSKPEAENQTATDFDEDTSANSHAAPAAGLSESSSVMTVVSDTPSHGLGIASRALKQVAKGSHTSFGLSNRFETSSALQRRRTVDRMYDTDTGTKCGIAKSVSSSLFGSALAHSTSQRFPIKEVAKSPGPGSYSTSYNLISKRIGDRWDMRSPSFKPHRKSNSRKRLGHLGQSLLKLEPTVLQASQHVPDNSRGAISIHRTDVSGKGKGKGKKDYYRDVGMSPEHGWEE